MTQRAATTLALTACALWAGSAVGDELPRSRKPSTAPVHRAESSVCATYGAGFVNVPGTSTCVKLGGNVRIDYSTGSGGSSVH